MASRKNLHRRLGRLAALGVLGGVVLLAQATNCGQGLAAEDLSGACRASPATMGALEAVGLDNTPGMPPAFSIEISI